MPPSAPPPPGVTNSKISIWSQTEFWSVEVRGFF